MIQNLFVLILAFVGLVYSGNITVSGVSSGGAFAVQFHVAYSSQVNGAGIVAGIPYWCAMDDLAVAETACMSDPSLIDVDLLVDGTKYAFSVDSIDDPTNLANSKVYLYSGTLDTVVVPGVVQKLLTYYSTYISSSNIVTEFTIESNHAMVTNSYGNNCSYLGEPYINNCHYDAAGDILQTIYGTLKSPVAPVQDNIVTLSQAQFIQGGDPEFVSFGPNAYLYIPSGCNDNQAGCQLHVAFHGCEQTIAQINTTFVTNTGYNGWAEANNIIILYPQVIASTLNPEGCWDWWGYTGSAYATKLGIQMSSIKNMIDYVLSNY